MATVTGHRVEDIAQELFQVVTQICLSTLRGRRRAGDLKEVEFLTLSLLQAHGTMIVGDIQRVLGVLPAQMSRVIRALENRGIAGQTTPERRVVFKANSASRFNHE